MRSFGCKSSGFTLVELLLGLALSLGLLAGLLAAAAQLQGELARAVDRAAMAERGGQALDVIAEAVSRASSDAVTEVSPVDPCASPVSTNVARVPRMMLTRRGVVPCFPQSDMPPDAALLVVDTLKPCSPRCASPSAPGFLYLNPGCHPIFRRTTPEIRQVARQRRPADCDLATEVSVFDRQLFYFRDFAWRRGDGLGAIMVKRLKPGAPVEWSQADRLVGGIAAWEVAARFSEARCPEPLLCATAGLADGVVVQLTARAWVHDATAEFGLPALSLQRTLPGPTRLLW